jgi:hypothetical protein
MMMMEEIRSHGSGLKARPKVVEIQIKVHPRDLRHEVASRIPDHLQLFDPQMNVALLKKRELKV